MNGTKRIDGDGGLIRKPCVKRLHRFNKSDIGHGMSHVIS